MIPEAAVEAAMVAQYDAERRGDVWVPFADMPAEFLDRYKASALLILEAAATHMLAQGWDEGVAYVYEGGAEVSDENPYRTSTRQSRTENGTVLTSPLDSDTP